MAILLVYHLFIWNMYLNLFKSHSSLSRGGTRATSEGEQKHQPIESENQTLPHVASHANATTISLHMGGTLYHHEKKTTKKTKSVSQNRTPPFPQVTACATQHHNHNAPKQLFFFFFFFTILNSFLLLLTWDPLPRTLLVPLRT